VSPDPHHRDARPHGDPVFACSLTGEPVAASVRVWRSAAGAPLVPRWPLPSWNAVDEGTRSVWRYRAWLPLPAGTEPLTLGEGGTPLVPVTVLGIPVQVKVDYLQPTGSYKDRGSAVLAAALTAAGVRSAVEDSSGNAGASLAAYLGRAGIALKLFVPQGTPPVRVAQAAAAGAKVDTRAATRAQATELAMAAATGSVVYASHVYSPYFLAGQATMAFELYEELGRRAPDRVIVPVGHGVLLLGLYHGFRQLQLAGLTGHVPRLYGVQAAVCAPVYQAFAKGADCVTKVAPRRTAAVGISIAEPPRGREVLAAVRETGGAVLSVSEAEIRRGQSLAAKSGWYVEAASAAAVAAVAKLDKVLAGDGITVLPLTGSGLKQ